MKYRKFDGIFADEQKNKMPLDGTVGPGTTKTNTVAEPVPLSSL